MPTPTKEERAAAARAAFTDYVDSRAAVQDLRQDPKYFAALASWCYRRPGDTPGLWWKSPGAGLTAHVGGASDPLPPPANDDTSGYDAGVFHHAASGTLIVVNRGTETERDWLTNAAAFIGIGSKQMRQALDYAARAVMRARDMGLAFSTVALTGQSLGGGLVQAQHTCLNHRLAALGHPPVNDIRGFGFASAPFENDVVKLLAEYGEHHTGSDALDAAFPQLQHWIRPGDPIRSPMLYLREAVVGTLHGDVPDIYTISRNPQWMTNHHGAKQFRLEPGRTPAHDSFRYFLYFGRPADQCVVVNTAGSDFLLNTREPDRPHEFNSIPKAYRKT